MLQRCRMATAFSRHSEKWSFAERSQPYILVKACDDPVPHCGVEEADQPTFCADPWGNPQEAQAPASAGRAPRRPPHKFSEDRESRQREELCLTVRHQGPEPEAFEAFEVPLAAAGPMRQVRICVAGLLALAALRCCGASVYGSPTGMMWTADMLSMAADGIAIIGALPVFMNKLIGTCVHNRCLGSLLTLLLTATVCDAGAAVMFLSSEGDAWRLMWQRAVHEGAPKAVAFIGVRECFLISSISLELALCASAWHFYRAFREAGAYPPNIASVRVPRDVSPLEFLCEAEDVALLSDHCEACRRDGPEPLEDAPKSWDRAADGEGERHGGYGYPGIGGHFFADGRDKGYVPLQYRDQELDRL